MNRYVIPQRETKRQLADAFAEIACENAKVANDLMGCFPSYREAKDNAEHPFWSAGAFQMLKVARLWIGCHTWQG